jgi:hypothetical protein
MKSIKKRKKIRAFLTVFKFQCRISPLEKRITCSLAHYVILLCKCNLQTMPGLFQRASYFTVHNQRKKVMG